MTKNSPNEIIDCGNYYEICLYSFTKKGCESKEIARTKIDKKDFKKIRSYKWRLVGKYVYSKKAESFLHRLIMGKPSKIFDIDHINHNTLDNRKQNLRIVTHQQNEMNRKRNKNNTSGTSRIHWNKEKNKWTAQIKINYKTKFLGHFINKQDAINARRQAEQKYFGEFVYKH